jgi:hypothetical protein
MIIYTHKAGSICIISPQCKKISSNCLEIIAFAFCPQSPLNDLEVKQWPFLDYAHADEDDRQAALALRRLHLSLPEFLQVEAFPRHSDPLGFVLR